MFENNGQFEGPNPLTSINRGTCCTCEALGIWVLTNIDVTRQLFSNYLLTFHAQSEGYTAFVTTLIVRPTSMLIV